MINGSNLLRYHDGSYGFGLPAGPLTFADGNEAAVYFDELARRVRAAEREACKVAASQ